MNKQTEALRMAIEWFTDVSTNNEDEVIQACKEALAEQPKTEALKLIQEHIDMQQYQHAWDKCQELIENEQPTTEQSSLVQEPVLVNATTHDGQTYKIEVSAPSREWVGLSDECQCQACVKGIRHDSDCAVHNAPAYPIGECDCKQPADGIELEWYCKGWDDAEKDLATQEPVTHVIGLDNDGKEVVVKLQKPLYTTPPSREWIGLSDAEVQEVFNLGHKTFKEFASAIEAKLKEKNELFGNSR